MDYKTFQILRKRYGSEMRKAFSRLEDGLPGYSYDAMAVYLDSAISVMFRFRQYLDFVIESKVDCEAKMVDDSIVNDAVKESENGVS